MCACLAAQPCLTLLPQELQTTRLLCPWDSPGKDHMNLKNIWLRFYYILRNFI